MYIESLECDDVRICFKRFRICKLNVFVNFFFFHSLLKRLIEMFLSRAERNKRLLDRTIDRSFDAH